MKKISNNAKLFDEYRFFTLNNNIALKKSKTHIDLGHSEIDRKRTIIMDNQDFYEIGERWGNKLSLHRVLLSEIDKIHKTNNCSILDNIINDVFYDNDEKRIKTRLSEIGRYFKIVGDKNKYASLQKPGDYIYFINLEMLGDYASSDINEASQGLDKWLLIEKEINCTPGIREDFYKYFDIYLKEFFNQNKPYNKKREMMFSDFIEEVGCWATEGSSGQSIKNIDSYNEFRGYIVNNKKIFGLLMNKNKLRDLVNKRKVQRMKVNIKRELVKSRGVVNSDVETYLLMAYINYLVEGTLYGVQSCTLLQKDNDSKTTFLKNMIDGFENGEINLPLDQSAFDSQVDFTMIRHCYQMYKEYCKKFFSENNDLENVFLRMDDLLLKGQVVLGKEKVPYKNGIPSGWRWTSLFDSAINYAQCKTIEKLLQNMDILCWLKNLTVQGDDVQCTVGSNYAGEAMIALFDELGLEINRKKMFISTERSEYLRLKYSMVSGGLEIRGIPVRGLPTLFFRSPITSDQMSLNSLLDQWFKIIRRYELYESKKIFDLMITDCFNFLISKKRNNSKMFLNDKKYKRIYKKPELLEISKQDIRNYIFTGSNLGGYGLGFYGIEKIHFKEDNFKPTVIKSYMGLKYANDEIKLQIEKIKKLASEIVMKNNREWNWIPYLRYVNEECSWYGENKRYIYYHDKYAEDAEMRNIRLTYDHGRNNKKGKIHILSDILDKIGNKTISQHLSLNVNRVICSPNYRGKTYELSVDSQVLYTILKEHTNTDFETRMMRGWYIERSEKNFQKWLDSSISFQNRVLVDNETFITNYKNIYIGMNIHNLLVSEKINLAVNTILDTCRWSSGMLNLVQRIGSQYTVDPKTIRSSE